MSCIEFFGGVALGFIGGVVSDFGVSLCLSYCQFRHSTANYRLEKTLEATKKMIESPEDRSPLRDEYRYSLGVIIDHLEQVWEKDDFKDDKWPCLFNFKDENGRLDLTDRNEKRGKVADRWDWFDQYIRPVIVDVNAYSFLGRQRLVHRLVGWLWLFRPFSEKIDQIDALTKLYNQLETVTSKFDAAYQVDPDLVEPAKADEKVVIQPTSEPDPKGLREALRKAYCDLYHAWREWRELSLRRD
jgi:hypothetical protein